MLEIDNLHARVDGKDILRGLSLALKPGEVHALFRSTDGRVYRSDSADDGRSWERAYPIDLPNNNSGLDVVRMRSGLLALACNPVEGSASYLAAEASWAAADMCVQTFGGFGFAEEYDVERKFRETRLYRVAPISTNMILSYIAEHILDLPRSY